MKKSKKLLSILLSLALIFCILPATAFALDENETDIISSPCITRKTPTTISVSQVANVEYRLGTNGSWTTDTLFTGLYPNTTYTIYYRFNGGSAFSLDDVTTPEVTSPAHGEYIDTNAPYQLAKTGYLSTFELQNDLSYYLYVNADKFKDYTDLRLYVMHKTYSGNTSNGWKVSIVSASSGTTSFGGYTCYSFCVKGIAAAQLNDDICLTLYAKNKTDGHTYITPVYTTSMAKTALSLVKGSSSSNFQKVIVDLVNYASAAQTFFNYNTDHLANAEFGNYTGTQNNPVLTSVNEKIKPHDNPTAKFTGYELDLNSKIGLYVSISLDESITDTSKIKLKVSYSSSNTSVGTITSYYKLKGNRTSGFYFVVDGIAAADFGQTLTISVYNDSTEISHRRTYSIETLVKSMLDQTSNANLKIVLWAMMKYSRSAKTYFSGSH